MPGFAAILRILFTMLAGVGALEACDRIFPGKVAGYEPVSPGLKLGRKLAFFVGGMTAGGLAWHFINRKFHIVTPRHAPRRRGRRRRRR